MKGSFLKLYTGVCLPIHVNSFLYWNSNDSWLNCLFCQEGILKFLPIDCLILHELSIISILRSLPMKISLFKDLNDCAIFLCITCQSDLGAIMLYIPIFMHHIFVQVLPIFSLRFHSKDFSLLWTRFSYANSILH